MNARVDSLARAVFEAYSRNSGNPPECHRDLDAAIEWMAQALVEAGVDELARRARCWDDLQEARRIAHATPTGSGWKKVAADQGLVAGTRACRAELGIGLREARDCVEGYLNSRIGAD